GGDTDAETAKRHAAQGGKAKLKLIIAKLFVEDLLKRPEVLEAVAADAQGDLKGTAGKPRRVVHQRSDVVGGSGVGASHAVGPGAIFRRRGSRGCPNEQGKHEDERDCDGSSSFHVFLHRNPSARPPR